jgi:hypothetical protein
MSVIARLYRAIHVVKWTLGAGFPASAGNDRLRLYTDKGLLGLLG